MNMRQLEDNPAKPEQVAQAMNKFHRTQIAALVLFAIETGEYSLARVAIRDLLQEIASSE